MHNRTLANLDATRLSQFTFVTFANDNGDDMIGIENKTAEKQQVPYETCLAQIKSNYINPNYLNWSTLGSQRRPRTRNMTSFFALLCSKTIVLGK